MSRHRFASALLVIACAVTACEEPLAPYGPAATVGKVRVAFSTDPMTWSADPMTLDSAEVEGDTLSVFVTHGGGCEEHEYAAVAWNGWLESNPVQVGVFVAHKDHDDPCDALIMARLRFDLEPLREAYHRAYGSGAATLIMRLGLPGQTVAQLPVEYVF